MIKYQVWMEGYCATGMEGIPAKATYKGTFEANSFREACDLAFKLDCQSNYYDRERLTYWGCRLYDNEIDARKSFG